MLRERKLEENFEQRLAEEAAAKPRRSAARSLSVVLAVTTMAVASLWGATMLAERASGPGQERVISELSNQVGVIQEAVSGLYSGQSNYDDLDDDILIRSGRLPRGMTPKGSIVTTLLGSPIHVGATDKGFSVRLDSIPGWACSGLATSSQIGDGALTVQVSSAMTAASPRPVPMEADDAREDCGPVNGRVSIEWVFR